MKLACIRVEFPAWEIKPSEPPHERAELFIYPHQQKDHLQKYALELTNSNSLAAGELTREHSLAAAEGGVKVDMAHPRGLE